MTTKLLSAKARYAALTGAATKATRVNFDQRLVYASDAEVIAELKRQQRAIAKLLAALEA